MNLVNCDAHLQNPIQVKVHFDANKRVFVIGDLDADLAKFEQALKSVNFDKNHDVLFSLGDVIDRGADSVKLIKRFIELGVYMSLGNHEHMLLESLLTHDKDYFSLWVKKGGRWHIDTSDEELEFVCNYLRNRPLSYLLDYRGAKIGLSHTVSHNWNWLVSANDKQLAVSALLWERTIVKQRIVEDNPSISFSIHGHNTTQTPYWLGNTYHIDTNYLGGKPTIVELERLINQYSSI